MVATLLLGHFTRMWPVRQILRDQSWRLRMTEYDFRALTPLVCSHVNPYGIFELDMEQRLPIEVKAVA